MHVSTLGDTVKLGAKSISDQVGVEINAPASRIFTWLADNFTTSYPIWAADVESIEPLSGSTVEPGSTFRLNRIVDGSIEPHVIRITEFIRDARLAWECPDKSYSCSFTLSATENPRTTLLSFNYTLQEVELFMRPFAKLIKNAIHDGVSHVTTSIQDFIHAHPELAQTLA